MDRSKPMERTAIQVEVGPVEELFERLQDILKASDFYNTMYCNITLMECDVSPNGPEQVKEKT